MGEISNAGVLRNKVWSPEIGREKKGQQVSLGQVQLTPLASPWMGPRGCGDWVALHLGGMNDPLFSTVPLASFLVWFL